MSESAHEHNTCPTPREIALAPKMLEALRVIVEIDRNSSEVTASKDLYEAAAVARCMIAQVENRAGAAS